VHRSPARCASVLLFFCGAVFDGPSRGKRFSIG
jgi:hypothetical protein